MRPEPPDRAEEIACLQERIRLLEKILAGKREFPAEWRLQPSHVRIMRVLIRKELASDDDLMEGLYWDRVNDWPGGMCLKALICYTRKRLKPFGISIHNVFSRGYRLDDDVRKSLFEKYGAER